MILAGSIGVRSMRFTRGECAAEFVNAVTGARFGNGSALAWPCSSQTLRPDGSMTSTPRPPPGICSGERGLAWSAST